MTRAVFVPGLLCTGELYSPQIEVLAGLDAMVGDHQSHESISDIAAGILTSAPDRFVLVGLSMGGYISFEILRQAAERVQALILLDTGARPDAPEKSDDRMRLIGLAEQQGITAVVDELTPHFLARRHLGRDDLKLIIARMGRETGPQAFARQQKAIMGRADSRPTLAAITCPTLVVVGDEDTLTPPELAKEIADGIGGSRLEIIPECGHLATLEQPGAVTAAIKSFLEGAGIRS